MSLQSGKLIFDIRTNANISQRDLARGIISIPQLSRIENGSKAAPYVVLEALLQRMGKHCDDRFDIEISEDEYDLYFIRSLLLHNADRSDLFDRLLVQYEDLADMEQPLERQYVKMMRGCALYMQNRDPHSAAEQLANAAKETLDDFSLLNKKHILLCTQELQVLLLLSYCLLEGGNYAPADEISGALETYVHAKVTDMQEFGRIFPLLSYLIAKSHEAQGDISQTLAYLEEGLECLRQNGLLTLAKDFLALINQYGKNVSDIQKQSEAFRYIYQMAGVKPDMPFMYFMQLKQNKSFILISEFIRDTRTHHGLSQEELSWDICATETLSRLERGKGKPRKDKLQQLYQRLGLDKAQFMRMDTDDYSLLEKDWQLGRCLLRGETQMAEEIWNDIRSRLDKQIIVNAQYIEYTEIILKENNKSISYSDALILLESVLKYTYSDYQGEIYRMPIGNEFDILLLMAICRRHLKDLEGAESIYKNLDKTYSSSHVDDQFHASKRLILYNNLTGLMEVMNKLDESEMYAMKGIRLAIQCQRGDIIGNIVSNLSLTFRKKDQGKVENREAHCLRAAYWLLVFYKNSNLARTLQISNPQVEFF